MEEPPAESARGYESSQRSDYTADRLHREAPDQYEAVRSGEKSLNAAAVEAGIRPRRLSVRLDDPLSIARSLHRNMPPEDFADLVTEAQQLLVHRDDDP
jgi:hypothetical protein